MSELLEALTDYHDSLAKAAHSGSQHQPAPHSAAVPVGAPTLLATPLSTTSAVQYQTRGSSLSSGGSDLSAPPLYSSVIAAAATEHTAEWTPLLQTASLDPRMLPLYSPQRQPSPPWQQRRSSAASEASPAMDDDGLAGRSLLDLHKVCVRSPDGRLLVNRAFIDWLAGGCVI